MRTPAELSVDSHELIALCAPRPVFISYGIPDEGDAHWLDHRGSFMAAVAAGKVYRLLGARDLGQGDDYRKAVMPPVKTGLLDGALAWRQHDGGHTDTPNVTIFLNWADKQLGTTARSGVTRHRWRSAPGPNSTIPPPGTGGGMDRTSNYEACARLQAALARYAIQYFAS